MPVVARNRGEAESAAFWRHQSRSSQHHKSEYLERRRRVRASARMLGRINAPSLGYPTLSRNLRLFRPLKDDEIQHVGQVGDKKRVTPKADPHQKTDTLYKKFRL